MNRKLCVVVVGPTASGKSELAVQIAKKFDGEIISADSRQIYRGMDIGSGKVEGIWLPHAQTGKLTFTYKSIPHYLIDEASPRVQYSVAKFQKKATTTVKNIFTRDRLPVICGGTGLWIDALAFNRQYPEVKPDTRLRKSLAAKSAEQLVTQLKKIDPIRAESIDRHNPRRLIRALEIVLSTKRPVPEQKQSSPYNLRWIGLNPGSETLHDSIASRLDFRLKAGMIEEVQRLRDSGISWHRLESFGLEYKYCALLLQNKIGQEQFRDQLFTAIRQYAKRQMTWWKRNRDIHWYTNTSDALQAVQDFFRSEANS